MNRYIGLTLALLLILGASVSQAEWQVRVHRGRVSAQLNLSEIDSLSFNEVPSGMVWIPSGNVRLGQAGIAEPVSDFYGFSERARFTC